MCIMRHFYGEILVSIFLLLNSKELKGRNQVVSGNPLWKWCLVSFSEFAYIHQLILNHQVEVFWRLLALLWKLHYCKCIKVLLTGCVSLFLACARFILPVRTGCSHVLRGGALVCAAVGLKVCFMSLFIWEERSFHLSRLVCPSWAQTLAHSCDERDLGAF